MTVHLTHTYRWDKAARVPGDRASGFVPIPACRAGDGEEQVSIYPAGEGEDRIDCPACLQWLARGDNRLLILDTDEWIRRHAGDADIRCIDI